MSTTESAATGQVRGVMTAGVLGIVPSAPLEVALRMMVEAGVRHLPVVDGEHCVGLLTESDVLWRLWVTADRRALTVAAAVHTPPLAVGAEETVPTAVERMRVASTDAALVFEHGRLVGILTVTDILRVFAAGQPTGTTSA